MCENGPDVKLLANLFKECERQNRGGDYSSSDDDENFVTVKSSINPGSIGKQKKANESVYKSIPEPPLTEEDYQKNQESLLEACRETPKYDICYRQAVSPEDVFLQLGNRSASTASCENMILTIYLPQEQRTSLDLNIKFTEMKLTSPKYKLEMPFPHPVDPQQSNAKWDPESEKLILTLKLNREYDYVNF